MKARKHQSDAIEFCLSTLQAGHARCVVQMPTGSGKSFVERRVVEYWLRRGGSAYLLCPTEEVIHQQRIDALKEGLLPTIEKAELHASPLARFVIGSNSTMWRRGEKHRKPKTLAILDECHHFNFDAPTNLRIANIFERVIGFSATPWAPGCLEFFENRLHIYPLSQSIREGINCKYHVLPWSRPTPGRYQIVYCSNMPDIQDMCQRILPSDFAVYNEKDARRTISRFRYGGLGTIVVNRMLTEGFDLPQIKRVWIAKNTESMIHTLQMAGRAFRPYRNQEAEIYITSPQTLVTLEAALARAE